jgi:hypothetical protein
MKFEIASALGMKLHLGEKTCKNEIDTEYFFCEISKRKQLRNLYSTSWNSAVSQN